MKKLALIFLTLSILSCNQEEEKKYTVITGTVESTFPENIVIRGNDFEETTPISPEGKFQDTLYLKTNGFYQLYVGRERADIYLEKGKNISLEVNTDRFDETLKFSGDLGKENNYLTQKYLWENQHMDFQDLYSSEEDSFMKKLDAHQNKLDSLYGTFQIINKNFKTTLTRENQYNKAIQIENYVDGHRYFTGNEDYQASSNFYSPMKDLSFNDTLAYRNSLAYQHLLDAHFNRLVNEEINGSEESDHTLLYLKKVDASLPDGYAKDKIMVEFLRYGLKPDNNLDEAYAIYKNSNPNPANLEQITERYNQLQTITAGKPSPTFTFENHKGGTTSLEDLKGKYVYVDVWATWCGPCLREIPAMKKVEEDYRGKNIEFVGISIDEPKDYAKWKQMVTDKSLAGIQLMADNNWNSEFVQEYGILGIPRFILIDPEGNIVAADAPRPSDPLLREKLDELL